MSGRTHFWLAFVAFELAAIIAAGVVWSYWADWHQTAIAGGHHHRPIERILTWDGLRIRRVLLRPELIVGIIAFVLANGAIGAFFALTDQQQPGTVAIGSAQRAKLMDFYDQMSGMAYQQLPKQMTEAEYDQWDEQSNEKIDAMQEWIKLNMGQGAFFRVMDMHNLKMANFTHAVNQKHNTKILMLLAIQANLREMIETSVWDKK